MFDLTKLRKGKQPRPPRMVIYGPHGIGKTTFANDAQAVIVPTEDGLTNVDVKAGAFPVCKSYDEVKDALETLLASDHSFRAVSIDTIDWLERLIFKKVCEENQVSSIEKAGGGYGKGYIFAMDLWHEFFSILDRLRDEKGMAIILLAHTRIVEFKNPEGEPYDRYQLDLHESKRISAVAKVMEWADMVLFANYKIVTQSVEGDKKKRGKGKGKRELHTEERPAYQAKNRYNLPPTIEFSWAALMSALKGEKNGSDEV